VATVLIVDDESTPREAGRAVLRQVLGCDVLTAESGEQGLEAAATHPVDALVVDVRLPDMSGLDLLRELRGRGIAAPAVVITAYCAVFDAREAVERAQELGISAFFTKPFSVDELVAAIRQVLDARAAVEPT